LAKILREFSPNGVKLIEARYNSVAEINELDDAGNNGDNS
jgi:hypothetical protein